MLKRYHPVAHIVRDGWLSGMILTKGLKPKVGVTADIVDMEHFRDLVTNNEVQFFQMGNCGPVVKYTDEERDMMINKYKSKEYSYEEYFKNDFRFNAKDIMRGSTYIAVAIVAVKEYNGMALAYGALYRPSPFEKYEIRDIKKLSKTSLTRVADNFYTFIGDPIPLFKVLPYASYKQGFGANYDMMFNMDNIIYNKKVVLFKNPSQFKVRQYVDQWKALEPNPTPV